MPDEKRNQKKGKSQSKEQRKPSQAQPAEIKKHERKAEAVMGPKGIEPIKINEPGPDSNSSLKNTGDVLKITEEENTKYKKKEITSNWSKYELPLDSYDDIDIGADYQKLIQAAATIGGHFRFKHEKSWDINTGPSLYDKYFDINMDNLAIAMSTIPFYERNDLAPTMFTETDLMTMNNRSVNYKQKYYKDKVYSTPEMELQEKMLQRLKEDDVETCSSEKASNNMILDLKVPVSPKEEKCKEKAPNEQEKAGNPVVESPEDLEKWLDDFLDN